MSRKRKSFCWGVSVLGLCLTATLGAAAPATAAEECKELRHLGQVPSSRLHDPVATTAELKQAFAEPAFQQVVQRVFDEADLSSLAPKLIDAVAGLPDDTRPVDVPVGAKFDWMAYRGGRPALMRDACWAGEAPFKAWKLILTGSDGADFDFIVPAPCLNLSRVEPPSCHLEMTQEGDAVHLDLGGSRAGGLPILSYGGTVTREDGSSAPLLVPSDGKVTYTTKCEPGVACSFHFALWAGDALGFRSSPKECTRDVERTPHTAPVPVCADPVADLKASYDCNTRRITADAAGSSEQRKLTITGPNGSEVLAGNGPWTYDVPRPGSYQVELAAGDGVCPRTATDSRTVEAKPLGDTARWTTRLFGAYVRAADDASHETLSAGTPFEERRQFKLGGHHGGFGAGVEYRPLRDCDLSRLGFAFDAIRSQLDAHVMIDNPQGWGMEDQAINFLPLLLSLNYHLTPGRPADFFLGPTVGYALFGDATFHVLGRSLPERYQDVFIYGLNLGVDVPFGAERNHAFTAGLRQLFVKAKAEGPSFFSLDLHPTIATAGVAFRFR
jgi:hypothetical protein